MARLHLFICATYYLLMDTTTLTGLHMRTPDRVVVVKQDSDEAVVLDCNYSYDHFEVKGLTVKWFWHRDHEPVYQWIPGGVPEVRGILKNRVNVSYFATQDRYSSHRALQILNPTSELSGKYTCTVSTYYDEKKQTVGLLVYEPANMLELKFRKPTPTKVNATCTAHGLFPEPRMTLYARTQSEKYEIRNVNIHIVRHSRTNGEKIDTWEKPVIWEDWGETIKKTMKRNSGAQFKKRKRTTKKLVFNTLSRNTFREFKQKQINSFNSKPSELLSRYRRESFPSKGFSLADDLDGYEPGGLYSIYADVLLSDEALHEDGQLLECEVHLPGTSYVERTNVVYFPGQEAMELYAQESTSESCQCFVYPALIILSLIMTSQAT